MKNSLQVRARSLAESSPKILIILIVLLLFVEGVSLSGNGQQPAGDLTGQQKSDLEQARLYNEEAKKLYKERRFDEAIQFAQKAIEFNQAALGTGNPTAGQLIDNLAVLYTAKGDFTKAENYRLQAIGLREKSLGKDHAAVADAIGNLGLFYKERGDYTKAEAMNLKALAIYEKSPSANQAAISAVCNNLGALYRDTGKYDKAEPLFVRSLTTAETVFGAYHPNLVIILNGLAAVCQHQSQYAKAEAYYLRALEIIERRAGKASFDYAKTLDNLASLYLDRDEFVKAEGILLEALAVQEKLVGDNHVEVATTLNNLAIAYLDMDEYEKAEIYFTRALKVYEKLPETEPLDMAAVLGNLASVYRKRSLFDQAEPLYLKSLAIREKALGLNSPIYAETLINLSVFYESKGDYPKAENYGLKASAILEKTLGVNHPEFAHSLRCLAVLYEKKGDYARAESLYSRILTIYEKVFGLESSDVALVLNDLGALAEKHREYTKAEALFKKALLIREKIYGGEQIYISESLSELATLNMKLEDYRKAEPLLVRALQIQEKVYGKASPNLFTVLHNLAMLYDLTGQPEKAEPIFLRALEAQEKNSEYANPEKALILVNLAAFYRGQGKIDKSIAYQKRANDVQETILSRNFRDSSESENLKYLNTAAINLHHTLSLHIQSAPENAEAKRLALEILLQRKSRILDEIADPIAKIRLHATPEEKNLLRAWTDTRSKLAAFTLKRAGERDSEQYKNTLRSLEEQAEALESQISMRSSEFRQQTTKVTLAAVQQQIPTDAALVEFAAYRPFEAVKKLYLPTRYVAYILFNQGEPQFADLGEAKAIDLLIENFRKALSNPSTPDVGRGPKITGEANPTDVKKLGRELDEKLMAPVRRLLGEKRRVILSPDGALNLIPFAALVDEQNHYLIETYSFNYLTTGRDLLRMQTKIASQKGAVFIGNPAFDDASPVGMTITDEQKNGPGSGDYAIGNFQPLPGAEKEIDELAKLFTQANVMKGRDATEGEIKKLNRPKILHLATHGFFLPDRTRDDAEMTKADASLTDHSAMELMSRSGLALAGANKRQSGNEDGILTAVEVAGLDLMGTKLVVLSACETGLGDVRNSEGVYGLRRALVLAGAESQVISLWAVSDAGTQELMREYYKGLLAELGRGEALRIVQLAMLKNEKRKHPYYWASFIQSGEWANLEEKR